MCVTYGRVERLQEAIRMFLWQTYHNKQLVIFNSMPQQHLVFKHDQVRIINSYRRPNSLGECRNLCLDACDGEVAIVWDDDDVYLPWHISNFARRFVGVDWLHMNPCYAFDNGKITHIRPGCVNNLAFRMTTYRSGIAYPPYGNGEDKGFAGLLRTHANGKSFNLSHDDISFGYGWNNGVLHVSGGGDGHPAAYADAGSTAKLAVERGLLPSGRIVLDPKLSVDYLKEVADFKNR